MATPILLPRLGNTVESCILVDWKVAVGDTVAEGDVIAEVETDKAVMEVEASAGGTVLALLFSPGDDVEVMAEMAVVGEADEVYVVDEGASAIEAEQVAMDDDQLSVAETSMVEERAVVAEPTLADDASGISPRARHLAARKGFDAGAVVGSGPGGRIIERDVEAALAGRPRVSPVAEAKLAGGAFAMPEKGSGPGGRIMAKDLVERGTESVEREVESVSAAPITQPDGADEVETIPVKGIRKVIAQRMLESMQTTAQLTLNAGADAAGIAGPPGTFQGKPGSARRPAGDDQRPGSFCRYTFAARAP